MRSFFVWRIFLLNIVCKTNSRNRVLTSFDIWLASHASQFELQRKHKPGDAYNPEAFIDKKGYDAQINDLQDQFLKKVKGK